MDALSEMEKNLNNKVKSAVQGVKVMYTPHLSLVKTHSTLSTSSFVVMVKVSLAPDPLIVQGQSVVPRSPLRAWSVSR